jgi:Flavodoxin domain
VRAVVVYESMYGNTRQVAECVAEGLRAAFVEATVIPVREATREALEWADLLVAGGPTHVHAMSRPGTRTSAVEQADAHGLRVQDGAADLGLREWFEAMPSVRAVAAAAFDTRLDAPKLLTGQAARGIASRLQHHGFRLVVEPESFLVDKHTVLLPHELARAVAWGRSLAEHSLVAG